MGTIQDVADQINNKLDQINVNTQNTTNTLGLIKGDTSDIKNKLDALHATLQSGVVVLANGLFAIFEAEKKGNSLAEAQVEQNKTMICWLDNIAELLCDIKRKMNTQIEFQRAIEQETNRLKKLAERVHATETVEIERLEEVEQELRKCCPPRPVPPEPCPEPCRSPDIVVYNPKGQGWTPPERISQPQPIG